MEVKKARIEMEKTRLGATMNDLKQEGEAKAMLAAAKVLEAAFLDQTEFVEPPEVPATMGMATTRTQEYVNTHFHNDTNMGDDTKPDKKWDINNANNIGPSTPKAMAHACEYSPALHVSDTPSIHHPIRPAIS